MAEAGKTRDRAIASTAPASVDEAERTGDGPPATSTTGAPAFSTTTAAAAAAGTSPATTGCTVPSIDTAVDEDRKTVDGANSSARSAELLDSFLAELELYTSGDQVDASPCYTAFENVFGKPGVRTRMRMLINCIEGERRDSRSSCSAGHHDSMAFVFRRINSCVKFSPGTEALPHAESLRSVPLATNVFSTPPLPLVCQIAVEFLPP